jgi:hypothetical protein
MSHRLLESARAEACRQLLAGEFDALVEREKARLRRQRPLWHRLFPFVITITRRPT